jgi:hypothetical protein
VCFLIKQDSNVSTEWEEIVGAFFQSFFCFFDCFYEAKSPKISCHPVYIDNLLNISVKFNDFS